MFGSELLEVVIGVVFVFILISTICSTIREGIEAKLKTRAAYLERGIRELLHDKSGEALAKQFFEHPLIASLYPGEYASRGPTTAADNTPGPLARGGNLPSYIPKKNFAMALMDIAARSGDPTAPSNAPGGPIVTLSELRGNAALIQNEPVRIALLAAIDSAQGDLDQAQKNIEAWFDSAMDRVSGWYRRSTNKIVFWLAFAIAILLNVNTITIADYLYRNQSVREAIVAKAGAASTSGSASDGTASGATKELDSLGLPIGWNQGDGRPGRWFNWATLNPTNMDWWSKGGLFWELFVPIPGWWLTALAATLGAPFWFDMLNKLMVVRSTVKPHEKSPEEASEDRQLRKEAKNGDGDSGGGGEAKPGGGGTMPAEGVPEDENDIDGCDVEVTEETADEDLPPAEGAKLVSHLVGAGQTGAPPSTR